MNEMPVEHHIFVIVHHAYHYDHNVQLHDINLTHEVALEHVVRTIWDECVRCARGGSSTAPAALSVRNCTALLHQMQIQIQRTNAAALIAGGHCRPLGPRYASLLGCAQIGCVVGHLPNNLSNFDKKYCPNSEHIPNLKQKPSIESIELAPFIFSHSHILVLFLFPDLSHSLSLYASHIYKRNFPKSLTLTNFHGT